MKRRNRLLDWQRGVIDTLAIPWVGLGVLGIVVLLLYFPSLSNWGSVDDLDYIDAALRHAPPFMTFFRPLERWVNELNMAWLGYGDLRFSLAVNLAGFFVTLGSTYLLGRALLPRARLASLFAATLVALSSLSTTTTIQIDTISQQFATVFSLLFFLALIQAVQRTSRILFLLAFSFAALALLAKETSLGVLAAIPLATFFAVAWPSNQTVRQKLLTTLANYIILALIVSVYLGLRFVLGYSFSSSSGTGRYALALSPDRLLNNAVLYFSGLVYIGGSTLDFFPSRRLGYVIVSSFLTTLLFGVSLLGIFKIFRLQTRERYTLLALLLLTLAGVCPVIVTEQVSELHVYSSLPFFALFMALSFARGGHALAAWLGHPRVFVAMTVFSLGLFAWMAVGAYGKSKALEYVTDVSWRYFTQIQSFIEHVPQRNPNFCWTNREDKPINTYSVFVRDPQVLASYALKLESSIRKQQGSANQATVLAKSQDFRNCNYGMSLDDEGMQFELLR